MQRPGSSGPSPNPTPETVLITGGAGFIGSHLADELLKRGHRIRALDSLIPQVHGDAGYVALAADTAAAAEARTKFESQSTTLVGRGRSAPRSLNI